MNQKDLSLRLGLRKLIYLSLIGVWSCQTGPRSNTYESKVAEGSNSGAMSLASDRKHLDELRKEIPQETKKANDDLAFLLELFARDDRKPAEIRSEFDRVMRKRREEFDKNLKREREEFNKQEKQRREGFLKDQALERDRVKHRKLSRDESNQFFKDQNDKRNEFFQVEREKRNDFESDIRERRKTFEDQIREKQNWFNQEHKAFVKRQQEAKSTGATTEKESGK